MLPIDLTGRLALVTGGSGELGRVMCRVLADAGADVAVCYRSNAQSAEEVVQELIAKGRSAKALQADVTDPSAVEKMASEVRGSLGDPDIVVANAVVQYAWKSILEQPYEDFRSQFASCTEHLVSLAKAFAPAMIEKKQGRFIAINTECAIQCFEGMGAYSAGKRGMDGIVRVLARELGPHAITVNQVAPGWTYSDRLRERDDDPQAEYRAKVPLRRAGLDTEIANAVAFLASDLAAFITGHYLPVCGGNVMTAI
jgi:3-oxoacyl-[acyl-carrier protein] reductase